MFPRPTRAARASGFVSELRGGGLLPAGTVVDADAVPGEQKIQFRHKVQIPEVDRPSAGSDQAVNHGHDRKKTGVTACAVGDVIVAGAVAPTAAP